MSQLEPIDNGVRRFRPGLTMALCALILAGGGWLVFEKVREKQTRPEVAREVMTIEEKIEEVRSEPPPPSIHPLEGKRRLFLADGCLHRYQELTFTRDFSSQHEHPGAIIRQGDPCLWNFVGIPDQADVYRIFCADPGYPELHHLNLTYTRVLDDEVPQDDQAPYLTLRDDDLCEWRVKKLSSAYQDQYELYCASGNDRFKDASLGWTDQQEDLSSEFVTATLGEHGNPSWWILPEGGSPTLPRLASHLIVMNRGNILSLEDSREDFEENGHEIFRVQLETADDDFTRVAEDLNYVELVKAIRSSDPVIEHPDFPALLGMNPRDLIDGGIPLERKDPLFPLIIPLKIALHPHLIHELAMENTEFWQNEWESLKDFQSHLDESDLADGRIYRGERFTYIFVFWKQ